MTYHDIDHLRVLVAREIDVAGPPENGPTSRSSASVRAHNTPWT
jgi:hypothetical protein